MKFWQIIRPYSEGIIWLSALLILMITPISDNHFTLCPIHHLGFEHCPGCGVGRSLKFLLHGNIEASFTMHPFGLLAGLLLTEQIISNFSNIFNKNYKKNGRFN